MARVFPSPEEPQQQKRARPPPRLRSLPPRRTQSAELQRVCAENTTLKEELARLKTAPANPKLHFRDNGTFTICQFTDIHWKTGRACIGRDALVREMMVAVLKQSSPDLVLLTGDLVHGEVLSELAAVESLRAVVEPLEAARVPWAAVFGNHDDAEGKHDKLLLFQRGFRQEHSMCVMEAGPDEVSGVGNYLLQIATSAVDETPAAALYCLDSGALAPEETGGYAWIQDDQVRWFQETASTHQTHLLPCFAFFHIPIPEYTTMWRQRSTNVVGECNESISCPKVNSGFFTAARRHGVCAMFCGHDHTNDFDGVYEGVRLVYGRVSGWPDENKMGRGRFTRGARIIQLRRGVKEFDTWLCLADGRTIHQWQPQHTPLSIRVARALAKVFCY